MRVVEVVNQRDRVARAHAASIGGMVERIGVLVERPRDALTSLLAACRSRRRHDAEVHRSILHRLVARLRQRHHLLNAHFIIDE